MRPGMVIFVLFFGVAFVDAIRGGYWPRVAFWAVVGILFFVLDRRRTGD